MEIWPGQFQFEGHAVVYLSSGTVELNNGSISVTANGSWVPYGNVVLTTILSKSN